ncbi:MAG: sigma-70 family RNA polymerase sigma factor [Comamonadaceae bacterium]|nr:sigma-70 family RNA polymerase sigma factor [Comamonadaceae bacterium]
MSYDRTVAFESMVRAYSRDLYRFAWWLCRDRAQAEDLVQETFARAWKAWHTLRDERAVKGWLFAILRNEHASGSSESTSTPRKRILDQLIAEQQPDLAQSIDLPTGIAAPAGESPRAAHPASPARLQPRARSAQSWPYPKAMS